MMRPLFEPLPQHIDPWQFAKRGGRGVFHLPLVGTQLQEYSRAEALALQLEGQMDAQQRCRLQGSWQLTLDLNCQRCLEPLHLDLDEHFDYVLLRHERQEAMLEDEEGLICAEDTLDLAWFLEEEVLLASPMIAKHEHCHLPHQIAEEALSESRHRPFANLKSMMNHKE